MRLGRSRRIRQTAWVGLVALALNASVPVYIAFQLAQAFAAASPRYDAQPLAPVAGLGPLALCTGHHDADDPPYDPGRHDQGDGPLTCCAACLSLAALGSFAVPAAAVVPLPPPAAMPAPPTAFAGERATIALPYRSRAPPLA